MSRRILSASGTQIWIAAAFLSFGAAWIAAPAWLEQLFARDATAYPIVALAITALGAHAIAAGVFAASARFKSWTFPGFALSLLPVFAADYWLYAKVEAFNEMALVHLGGMVAVLALCVRGFRQLQRTENADAFAV